MSAEEWSGTLVALMTAGINNEEEIVMELIHELGGNGARRMVATLLGITVAFMKAQGLTPAEMPEIAMEIQTLTREWLDENEDFD